ncbi:hypothetical protein pb186bvf_020282 [Paramecium bursaria]
MFFEKYIEILSRTYQLCDRIMTSFFIINLICYFFFKILLFFQCQIKSDNMDNRQKVIKFTCMTIKSIKFTLSITNMEGCNEYFMAQQIKESKYKKYFVHYHRFIEEKGFYIIEMEHCQGDLQYFYNSFLSELNPQDREYYIFQILKEILKAHKCLSKLLKKKFIFRDLTLNNLLFDSNRIKLCDLEMIRIQNQSNEEILTQDFNQRYDYYLENEQNIEYDQSIDIHSLGVCLYRLYRGKEIIVYEDGKMRLPLGIENQISLRLKNLLESMLRIDPRKRITWDQLFENIYKETVKVLDITATFELDFSLKYKTFDFRFINKQMEYRSNAYDETSSQTRQNFHINLFMDKWCYEINKTFLYLIDKKQDQEQKNLIYFHFRMMMCRIEQLQNEMSQIEDEVDRFDLIEQLNQPIYLYRMFCDLVSTFDGEYLLKVINNEDQIVEEYCQHNKKEEAQYFLRLKNMKGKKIIKKHIIKLLLACIRKKYNRIYLNMHYQYGDIEQMLRLHHRKVNKAYCIIQKNSIYQMQKILIVAGLALLAASIFYMNDSETTFSKFESYKLKFGKSYSGVENQYRLSIYAKNLEVIAKHNADQSQTYFLKETKFSDLTQEEFAQIYLTARAPEGMMYREQVVESSRKNFGETDWRGITNVKDQGQCGSCWAFSAVGSAEAWYYVKYGVKVDLAEQQLNDCDTKSFGCSGGYNNYAIDYIATNGIAFQTEYPYKAVNQACKFNGGKTRVNGSQYIGGNEDNVKSLIVEYPVSVLVDASNWSQYGGGVFDKCNTNVNHAVLGVGFTNDGTWIVKNSWGLGWGEQGHIRLAKGNTCNVVTYAWRSV